jgi:hypothetical protein
VAARVVRGTERAEVDRKRALEKFNALSGLASPASKLPVWADWDGTVMEQRGRNPWQTFGSPNAGKWLELAPDRCHWLPPFAVWIAW